MQKNQLGFSLMEVLISVFIIMILMLGIYSLIILSLKVTADNKFYVEAIEIANQEMEKIRNLAYDDVGTVSGVPSGILLQNKTVVREGTYNVRTEVKYEKDSYDGLIPPADDIYDDYKIATIKVSWHGKFTSKSVTVFSKIIPNTLEGATGNGILYIKVRDSNSNPVDSAKVTIKNPSTSIDIVDALTDSSGDLYYSVPPAILSYEITVTKDDYGTDKTYSILELGGAEPYRRHLTVEVGEKTEDLFTIDELAILQIHTVNDNLPNNWKVNSTSTPTDANNVRFSADNSNNLYFVWQKSSATSSYVYLQKYDASADPPAKVWTEDKRIYDSSRFQFSPDIASEQDGTSYIVWQDNSAALKAVAYSPQTRLALNKDGINCATNKASVRLVSNKQNFQLNEKPVFQFKYHKKKKLLEKLITKFKTYFYKNFKAITVRAKVLGANDNFYINYKNNNEFSVVMQNISKLKSGEHKLKITVQEKGKTTIVQEYNFTYGVLAVNTNKSVYKKDEPVYLQMAALKNNGDTICNANLKLKIISPKGIIKYPNIKKSNQCHGNNIVNAPDYSSVYQTSKIGVYQIKLTNLDNGLEITDSFQVKERIAFSIERTGPTRIYPPAAYKMNFKIKVNQDFKGQIIESVPTNFQITPANNIQQIIQNNKKLIVWDVNWKSGKIYEPWYKFNAPNISPYLHYVGPLVFIENSSPVFYEENSWKIAADAPDPATIVQTIIGTPAGHVNSMTAEFANDPTEGNVIIAIASHSYASAYFTVPSNANGDFTESSYSNSSWQLDVGIWHKVVEANEPKLVTINCTGPINGGDLMLMEIAGLDVDNLINVITTNDQTSNSNNTATTGSTPQSADYGFAIAGIVFADNNFTTPNSSNWLSGSGDTWTHQLWQDWFTRNDASLAVATLNVNTAANQEATLTLAGGGAEQRNSALAIFNLIPPLAIISATGTQIATTSVPATNQYIGGSFVIAADTGSRNVTDITISEYGSVDAENNLSNIRLYYDLDTTAPYDCVSESYSGTWPPAEPLFGSATTSFSNYNGTASFNKAGGILVDTTQTMCVYVILDVGSGALANDTLEIEISLPSSDVVGDSGTIMPNIPVEIDGFTEFLRPAELYQIHYRFRNDDGDEISALWKENQDTSILITEDEQIRLRFEISNEGSLSSGPVNYKIQYDENCDNSSWVDLPLDNSLDWKISSSSFLTDGSLTTNIYGLSDENPNFVAGAVKDYNNNQTPPITLTSTDFTEIEYSIKPTASASSNDYCFRLIDTAGTANFIYQAYPRITIVGDDNVYITKLDSNGNSLWTVKPIKKINSDSSANQINPRIAITENFGQATTTIAWQDYRNNNSDIYMQGLMASGTKLWSTGDLQITSSSTDEHSHTITIDSNDNIFIAWVNNGTISKDVYMQKYDLNKNKIWTSHKNITNSVNDAYAPNLITDSSNNIYVSWTEDIAGVKNIYLAKYDSSANQQWSKQVNIESLDKYQYDSSLAVDNTYIYASWTDKRDGNEDIYIQRYDFNGNNPWTKDSRINVNIGSSNQNNSFALQCSAGLFVAWEDSRDEDDNIYAAKFNGPSAIIGVGNVSFNIFGDKKIADTIYEYDENHTTDGNGDASLLVEWDSVGYSIASSSKTITLSDPILPVKINPNDIKNIYLYVQNP